MDAEKLVSLLLEETTEVDDLVNNNIKLVHAVATRWFPYVPDKDELFSAGQGALLRAAEKYSTEEPDENGEKRDFLNYAYTAIRNAMNNVASKYLEDEEARGVALDVEPENYEGGSTFVPHPKELQTKPETDKEENSKTLRKLIDELPENQKNLALGVLAGDSYTDIAARTGVSRAYISTLAATTFQKLAVKLKNAGFANASDFFKESIDTESGFRKAIQKIVG